MLWLTVSRFWLPTILARVSGSTAGAISGISRWSWTMVDVAPIVSAYLLCALAVSMVLELLK